jgi:hypothetical protein
MNKIFIKISDTRLWILDYNFVCALFFIPITAYSSVKIRRIRIAKKLERERRLKELEKLKELERLYRILKIAGSSVPCLLFLKILSLRGGESVVIPGIDDCIDLETPSYVNEERILRFLNDRFRKFAIKGIIYITKEAFCYLVSNEGLVDLPVVFLERIKIDGIYSFTKTFSEWAVVSIGVALGIGGVIAPHLAIMYFGFAWLHIHSIEILQPRVKDVNKIIGEYVPRIESRKDAIVFDAKKEPLPPVIEKSIKAVRIDTLDTEYEITEEKLVDVSKVSKLKNKFSDRRFKRSNRRMKKPGKTVYFSDMVEKWRNQGTNDEEISIIDEMLREGII